MIFACDLDRTLIHGRDRAGDCDLVVVETLDGAEISCMSRRAHDLWARACTILTVVPVTTRTVAQLQRIQLPGHCRWMIAGNGGTILDNGVPDSGWERRVQSVCGTDISPDEVAVILTEAADLDHVTVREERFVSATVAGALSETALTQLNATLGPHRWVAQLSGRKLYALPQALTKQHAIRHLEGLTGEPLLAAAGDSEMDRELLAAAPHRLIPADSALAQDPPPGAWVTTRTGAAATEEILERVLALAAAATTHV